MIHFITVNYNSKDLIESLIASVVKGVTSSYKILIINNSPQECSIRELASDQTTVIESGDNIGFGRACNLGIQHVYRTDPSALIWLINPDATLDKDADLYVRACFVNHPTLAILGTRIRNTAGEIWFAAGEFNPWTGYINHSNHTSQDSEDTSDISSTAWVSGCSLIINLPQFSSCPAFDSSYFLYFEDADLCERTIRQGHQIAITRPALVTHQVSAIIGKNTIFMYRHYTFGRLLFLWRYAKFSGFLLYLFYLMAKVLTLLAKNPKIARGRWQGITAFLAKSCLRTDIAAQP